MGIYCFLTIMLPTLQIGTPPEISFSEFEQLLKDNLSKKDYLKARVIRRYFDIENLRALWKEEKLDPHANMNEQELEEAAIQVELLPSYARAFLERYDSKEDRLKNFSQLLVDYFRYESIHAGPFVRQWLASERQLRLLLAAYRAKKLKRDLLVELQFEDPDEPFIQQLLVQRDAPSLTFPEEFADLKSLIEEHYDNPNELYQALCEYRFYKVETMISQCGPFSVKRILGYMIQLILAENWCQRDHKQGMQIIDNYVNSALAKESK